MNILSHNHTQRWMKVLLLCVLFTGLGSCDVLEVDNPNNLGEEGLDNPAAVPSMVNGAEATVTRAIGAYLAPYSTASDELQWVGSRDAWGRLSAGDLADPLNEFSDLAYTYVAEGRWWADEVIRRVEAFQDEGTLRAGDENQVARANLYGAIMYITIADMFDDFVFSDRREAAPPIGPSNMVNLYDDAIAYINNGLAISGLGQELQATLLALRARAKYSRSVWNKLNPSVNTGNPLVNNADAAQDAADALALMPNQDFEFQLILSPEAPNVVVGDLSLALQVNQRLEMRISSEYVIPDGDGNEVANIGDGDPATSISIQDPVDNIPDPVVYQTVLDFTLAEQYADITVVSAREMHLILAEHDLANGNVSPEFEGHINDLRALDPELSAYDSGAAGAPTPQAMLEHSRRVNLLLQGRRLQDHYRFDDPSAYWEANSDADANPGTFFPIAITEIRANPNL